MKNKIIIKNNFLDIISLFLSFILSFFRSFFLLFNRKEINKNKNIFFDFLNYTFRIWPKYFWKKPNLYKISNYFSDLLNYLFKK